MVRFESHRVNFESQNIDLKGQRIETRFSAGMVIKGTYLR